MSKYLADGLMLGVFGLACMSAGDAAHAHDRLALLASLAIAVVLVPLILHRWEGKP